MVVMEKIFYLKMFKFILFAFLLHVGYSNSQNNDRNSRPAHLVLKNVNFGPSTTQQGISNQQTTRDYDIFDFSVYFPKQGHEGLQQGPYEHQIEQPQAIPFLSRNVLQKPLVIPPTKYRRQNFQSVEDSLAKGYEHSNLPHYEALIGPQTLHAGYTPPFYGETITVAPYTTTSVPVLKPQVHSIKTQRFPPPIQEKATTPKPPQIQKNNQNPSAAFHSWSSGYVQPQQLFNHQPQKSLLQHNNYFGNQMPQSFLSQYQAYRAHAPATPAPQNNAYQLNNLPQRYEAQAVSNLLPKPYPTIGSALIDNNRQRPHFEALTVHDPTQVQRPQFQHQQNYQSIRNPNNFAPAGAPHTDQQVLLHHSPNKELLINSVVYHDDDYTSSDYATGPQKESNDDKNQDGQYDDENDENSDEKYQVNEQTEESRKKIQKQLPRRKHHSSSFIIDAGRRIDSSEKNLKELKNLPPIQGVFRTISSFISNSTLDFPPLQNKSNRKRKLTPKIKSPFNDEIKILQDIFVSQNTPELLEFGHIVDTPKGWEERYEKKDLKDERHQGKVRWTDKNGGYGEHYWDLGHHRKIL